MNNPKPPILAVVIPNRNGTRHLTYSLESLAATSYQPRRTIMVDNCSTDDSCLFVSANYPLITIARNRTDLGFAASVNVGIRWARIQQADYLAVYSNDVRVPADLFEPAIDFMEKYRSVGIVGFTELRRSDPSMVSTPDELDYSDVGVMLPGMLYVCRLTALEEVGGYDEFYYMYGEEADLFSRVVRSGFRMVKTNVPVWHYVAGSRQVAPFKVAWYSYRNEIRFALKCGKVHQVLRRMLAVLYYAAAARPRPLGHIGSQSEGGSAKAVSSAPAETIREYQIRIERFRLGNIFLNLTFYFAALLWNLIFLPHTLIGRLRDSARIARIKRPLTHSQQLDGAHTKTASE